MFFVHLLIYEILFYLYNKNKKMIEVYKNLYGYDIINIGISIYRVVFIGAICTICLGLLTNYISDKLKSHSSSRKTKSGVELEIKIKFKITKN